MGWPELADRIQQAGQGVFGEPLTYTPSGGSPITTTPGGDPLTGIWTADAFVESVGVDVQTYSPFVTIREEDLSVFPARGDALEIRGDTFEVARVVEDRQGDIELWVKRP